MSAAGCCGCWGEGWLRTWIAVCWRARRLRSLLAIGFVLGGPCGGSLVYKKCLIKTFIPSWTTSNELQVAKPLKVIWLNVVCVRQLLVVQHNRPNTKQHPHDLIIIIISTSCSWLLMFSPLLRGAPTATPKAATPCTPHRNNNIQLPSVLPVLPPTRATTRGPRAAVVLRSSLYDLLGVTSAASTAEIRTAYRRLAARYHPDQNSSLLAHEKFQVCCACMVSVGVDRLASCSSWGLLQTHGGQAHSLPLSHHLHTPVHPRTNTGPQPCS